MTLRRPERPCASNPARRGGRPAPRRRPSAARFAHRPIDPVLEERVMACVEHRAGIPERFPAPLVALLLVTYAAEADAELEPFTEDWYEGFFSGWLAARASFPEELAPDVVSTVVDIVEGLVAAGVVELVGLVMARDVVRWEQLLADSMRASRRYLA